MRTDKQSSADMLIDPTKRMSISLPRETWVAIEHELRERGCWWLANQLVNTGHPVFSKLSSADTGANK